MSLLYLQGFDFMEGLADGQASGYLFADGWYGFWASGPTAVPGPFGGKALFTHIPSTPHSDQSCIIPIQTDKKVFFGVRTRYLSLQQSPYFWLGDLMSVYFEYPGRVAATCGGITAKSEAGAVTDQGWCYLEFMLNLETGGFEVRLNTEVVISVSSSTLASNSIDFWRFRSGANGSSGGSGDTYLDDIYMLNDDGTENNDYLGNVRIRSHLTVADGDNIDFVPTDAASNWQAVNSANFGKTSFVTGDAVDQYDLYDMTAGSEARNIYGICTRVSVRQADATQLFTKAVMKTGGAEFESPQEATQSSFRIQRMIYEVNPDTGLEWTNAELNTLQVGVKLSASD